MEQLFEKYQNIQTFAIKYRNYTLLDKKFDNYETFKNKMQVFEYIIHKFHCPKINKDVDIYLFKHDSIYISSTINFKKILDRYPNDHIIIMITKEILSTYRRKSIKQYPHLNIKNYLHMHFIMEINTGPLCSKHTILTPDEVRNVCYTFMSHGHNFPSIFDTDPQVIWIGGEINDLIKIEPYSEMTGKTVRYRIVTPTSGKVVQNPTNEKKIIPIVADATMNVINEEVSELEDNAEDYIDDYVENDVSDED